MISALKQFGLTRWLALLVFGSVLIGCMVGFHRGWSSDGYRLPGALDISGEWEFYNGKLAPAEAQTKLFPFKVQVPKPLPPEIREKLAEEFWYRKRFEVPKFWFGDLAISLGSIKGEHQVFWNDQYLGSGRKTGIASYQIPEAFLKSRTATLTVRVKRYETLFPGIVHFNSVVLGNADAIAKHQTLYYFENGLKRFVSAIIKLVLAMLFICLFLVTPEKREYLPFAIYGLLSAASAVSTSKFLPIFDDFYFKNSMQFLLSALSLAFVPIVTSAFLRMPNDQRSFSRSLGFAAPLVFLIAALLVRSPNDALDVYRMGNEWIPFLVGIPSLILCVYWLLKLDASLRHRKLQILLFSLSLLLGITAGSAFGSQYQIFQLFIYPEFLDLLVFIGLAAALVLDFRVISRRSDRAGKAIPKWFAGFLATGTQRVQFEIPMLVLAVDTVAYTKKLNGLSEHSKDKLHNEIRSLLVTLTEKFGAQKLSDGGDGGMFGWDKPKDSHDWKEIFAGVRYIASVRGDNFGVNFRAGVAAGSVRCEMNGGDFSFMGDALNAAARLESMSKPGEPLVDGSLIELIDPHLLEEEWIQAELKGVVYRGRALKTAA
ncbi:MAG: hypothetical protein EOP04_16370 [Proteobacteria bacterium]|nr:MAG: hypothetical protein EOP04_16370 [Pseudomonadota bacterium]